MQNYDHLGQVFKNLRTNRHISLKQISNERVSAAQISRFERGESDISLEKFLIALSNMHIEVSEFMDAVNNYQRTEQIRFMSALMSGILRDSRKCRRKRRGSFQNIRIFTAIT